MEKTEKNIIGLVEKPSMTLYYKRGNINKFTIPGSLNLKMFNALGDKSIDTELKALGCRLIENEENVYGVVIYDIQMQIVFCKIREDVLIDNIGFNDLIFSLKNQNVPSGNLGSSLNETTTSK